jgi:cytochrome oxidase Cu insertion factor (SCO1/SenC/PrrC family)
VWQDYNLLVEAKNVERVAHSAYVLLLDRQGKPRLYYSSQVSSTAVLRDLRRLLRSHSA